MNKKMRITPCVVIGRNKYTTAHGAANAYAELVEMQFNDRKTKTLGHAAYHDSEWFAWYRTINSKVYRRTFPIFLKVLKDPG